MTRTLLIAHADGTLVDYFRQLCLHLGYAVDTASGGIECLSKLQQRRPDALVLQDRLPWGGGDGVLARLREEGGAAMVPVVLICDEPIEAASDFLKAPVVFCLNKPYPLAQFLDCVRHAASGLEQSRDRQISGSRVAADAKPTNDSI